MIYFSYLYIISSLKYIMSSLTFYSFMAFFLFYSFSTLLPKIYDQIDLLLKYDRIEKETNGTIR